MVAKANQAAGYSGTPLWKKLDFKPDIKICAVDADWSGLKLTRRKNLKE